jgi:hypothetical protein
MNQGESRSPSGSCGGCGIRTREGVNPTRFPNPQTEVHVGLYFSVYACEAIAQTLPDGHKRGQLRPKLRPRRSSRQAGRRAKEATRSRQCHSRRTAVGQDGRVGPQDQGARRRPEQTSVSNTGWDWS